MMAGDPVTFFMYHDVRDPDATPFPKRYVGTSFLTPSQFDGQLDYVTKHYHVVPLVFDGRSCVFNAEPSVPDGACRSRHGAISKT